MGKITRIAGLITYCLVGFSAIVFAQNEYRYAIDLNKADSHTISVELVPPKLKEKTAIFCFPKIIPGTYSISDYGKFVSQVKAFDKTGKQLPVSKLSEDKWKISKAADLAKLTYVVGDIFDTKIKHSIYPMAATDIEQGKDFVINAPGFFGFFDGYNQLPFAVSISKPANLYGSTALSPAEQTATKDVFRVPNVDALYDSPIMYTVPDTTTVTVGNCRVLVSVYSPQKLLHSKEIAQWLSDVLDAAKQYLGGRLPTDKYAFLYYFKDPKIKHSFTAGIGGALEHSTSSFYYLPELPAQYIQNTIVNASTHEFFHIITPLTIASKQVKEFNYNEPVLSEHLWLYEGVTEYTAHYVQEKFGLISWQEFLGRLSAKITNSRTRYNDALPFTLLSKESAGKYADEYANVYEKGALIAACLDIYLLHLSKGTYGLKNLTYDLGIRYGKKRYFLDEELFAEIRDLTYPEIEDFLKKYVSGTSPIPYEYFFGLAGIKFMPKTEKKVFSIGGLAVYPNPKGIIVIAQTSKLNDFGKKVGYKLGDELYSINGVQISASNYLQVIDSIKNTMKEGDRFEARVGRKKETGSVDTLRLAVTVFKATETELNKLEPLDNATSKQKLVQQKWLAVPTTDITTVPAADSNDVNSIDAIIRATYNVISGPAGARNWDRFSSLFLPDAKMGTVADAGKGSYQSFSPKGYQRSNEPFFMRSGFYEEELNRKVSQFRNLATVASSYQYRTEPNGKVEQRGVNYFLLVNSEGRWWIANLSWQDENEKNKLPAEMEKN